MLRQGASSQQERQHKSASMKNFIFTEIGCSSYYSHTLANRSRETRPALLLVIVVCKQAQATDWRMTGHSTVGACARVRPLILEGGLGCPEACGVFSNSNTANETSWNTFNCRSWPLREKQCVTIWDITKDFCQGKNKKFPGKGSDPYIHICIYIYIMINALHFANWFITIV
jgi:hypothetical protein